MSVISQEPNFRSLEADPYSSQLIRGVLSECLEIARLQNCTFPKSYINDVIANMTASFPPPGEPDTLPPSLYTTMYQDMQASRPLEFEVYLGNPVRMAEDLGVSAPNLQALYALGRHINKSRTKPDAVRSPQLPPPKPAFLPRPSVQPVNGRGRGAGPRSFSDGPPLANGRGRATVNGHYANGPHRGSLEGELHQSKDMHLHGDPINEDSPANGDERIRAPHSRTQTDYDIRNRELMIRERELQLREREIEMQRRQARLRHNVPSTIMDDDEDESESRVAPRPHIQGENFDMMSLTGRRARKQQQTSAALRGKAPFFGGDTNTMSNGGRLMSLTRNKGRSASVMSQAQFDPLNENPLMGFTSNRYPGVDTRTLAASSRANSLTSQRMDELGMGPGAGRTASMLNSSGYQRGPPPSGRGGPMMPHGPSGRGRPPAPHSTDYGGPAPSRGYHDGPMLPPKDSAKVRSTTGSASASSASLGGNGESHSSSSSLEPPLHHGRL